MEFKNPTALRDPGKFWRFDLRQPINQWLCIGLMGIMCFWVVLYYFTHQATAVATSYAANINQQL